MKENINEDFLPIIRENYVDVRGKASRKNTNMYRENRERMVKRAIYVGAAVLALISGISFANSRTGKEIKYGLQVEKVFSDTYNKNPEFKKLSDSMKYCYDAGYGMPILSSITDPFDYGTPDCDDPDCVTCKQNRKIREELENELIKNPKYVAAKNNYLTAQGVVIDMDGGMSK